MHGRALRCLAIVAALALPGCTLGSVDSDGPVDLDGELPGDALCEVTLTLSGALAPTGGAPAPAEQGCVPDGTWTVVVEASGAGDCGDVPPLGPYVYAIAGSGRDRTITYDGPPDEDATLGMHAGGNGECEGSFEHVWSAGDGTFHVVLLKPYVDPGTTTMQGTGTYQRWSAHP